MRFGRQTHSLQCLALGESRLALLDRPSCFSTTTATTPPASPRRGYSSLKRLTTRSTRYPIIKNSLKKTLEAQRAVNRESVIRKFFVWDDKDEGKPGNEQQTDNVSEKTTNVKRSKKRKSRPSRKKKMQEVSGRLPWVVPFKDGHAPQRPWLDLIQQPSRQKGDARSILGNELLGLMTFLRPSSTEQDAVNHIIDDLSYKLQGIVPNPPELIGSRHAELATSISTIDLMILVDDDPIHNTSKDKPPAITPDMKYNYLEMLTQAEDVLKKDFGYRDCQVLFYKSSSLLFFHRASGLPVKLFCRNYPSKLEEFIRDSLRELPSLMPLCLIMRVFLESKSLFGWEAESLNSNALCLLIMAFLKQQPRDFTSKSLGEQLLSLLYTYGKQIDITTTCISASPAEFFTRSTILKQERSFIKDNMTIPDYLRGQRAILNYKLHAKHKGNTGVASHLCIQDPTNYLVDVGLRSFRTPELQRTFSGLYDDLKLALERWDEGHRDDDTILGQVLRADFRVLLRMKRRLTM